MNGWHVKVFDYVNFIVGVGEQVGVRYITSQLQLSSLWLAEPPRTSDSFFGQQTSKKLWKKWKKSSILHWEHWKEFCQFIPPLLKHFEAIKKCRQATIGAGAGSSQKSKQRWRPVKFFQNQSSKLMSFGAKKWIQSRNIQESVIILRYRTTL